MSGFKLSNIVLHVDIHAANHPEIYYRVISGEAVYSESSSALRIKGDVDFLTYVNACSVCKWRQYAQIDNLKLSLTLKGSGRVVLRGVPVDSNEPKILSYHSFDFEDISELSVPVEVDKFDLVGFSIISEGASTVDVFAGSFSTCVDASAVNDVRIALCTTTFKNEKYIIPNISLVKNGIAAEGAPFADNFHMFVVDNGRSLDVDALSDDVVTVLPNPNTGGSGGFARGMMAATEHSGEFTHVIVMDDDVSIMPESLIRTFNLLSLARGKYKDAFINGAMLSLEDPIRQFEDVSHVVDTAVYARLKQDLDVSKLSDILLNERQDIEVSKAYGAWWYSCIPVEAILKNGLPVPFFIRCDDVEFGMRNNPVYMTMDGICVWHASFEGRFRASVDCYQYTRNFLAMIAMDDCAKEGWAIMRAKRNVRMNLRDYDYAAAELTLDGIDDYLKGPEYLENLDGSALMMSNGKRNEKLVPVEELGSDLLSRAGINDEVLCGKQILPDDGRRALFMKYFRTLPYDKHYAPFLLSEKPGYVVKHGSAVIEGSSMGHKTVVFLDPTRTKGAVRHLDMDRFHAIRKRERQLMARYRKEGRAVRKAWKDARPYLTSREFWIDYLGL